MDQDYSGRPISPMSVGSRYTVRLAAARKRGKREWSARGWRIGGQVAIGRAAAVRAPRLGGLDLDLDLVLDHVLFSYPAPPPRVHSNQTADLWGPFILIVL